MRNGLRIVCMAALVSAISALRPGAAAAQQPVGAFGPVVERVLHDDDDKTAFVIDLDSGKVLTPPAEIKTVEERMAWIRGNGVDAVGDSSANLRGLGGLDVVVVPTKDEHWDSISTDDFRKLLDIQKIEFGFGDRALGVASAAESDTPDLLRVRIGTVPFDVAFEVYAECEGGERRRVGAIAVAANQIPGLWSFRDSRLTWENAAERRWRLHFVPSAEVARTDPLIKRYYDRELTVDWQRFTRSPSFDAKMKRRQGFLAARAFLSGIRDGDIDMVKKWAVEYRLAPDEPELVYQRWNEKTWAKMIEDLRQGVYSKAPDRLTDIRETILVGGDFAAVRIAPPTDGDAKSFYLVLQRLAEGWRVRLMDDIDAGEPLRGYLDKAVPVLEKNLASPPAEALKADDSTRMSVMSGKDALPATFLFRTREGGEGILQVLSIRDDVRPHDIRFRYKLGPGVFTELDIKIEKNLARDTWDDASKPVIRSLWEDYKHTHLNPLSDVGVPGVVFAKPPDVKDCDEYVGRYARKPGKDQPVFVEVVKTPEGRFVVKLEGHDIPAVTVRQSLLFTTGDVVHAGPAAGQKPYPAALEMFGLARIDGEYTIVSPYGEAGEGVVVYPLDPAAQPDAGKALFPKGIPAYKTPNQYAAWSMRLSPDGKTLLYSRPTSRRPYSTDTSFEARRARDQETFELVLLDLDAGRETVVPLALIRSGYEGVPLRFNPFDPSGKRLVLMDFVPAPAAPAPAADAGPQAPVAGDAYGPEIERLVRDERENVDCFIDLDRGTLISFPDAPAENMRTFEDFLKVTGADAMGDTKDALQGLAGFDMIAIPIAKERWDITPDDLKKQLAIGRQGTPAAMSGKDELPATYLIQTREGGQGVLQILSLSLEEGKPRGINIRYKLIQRPPAAKAEGATPPRPEARSAPGQALVVYDVATGKLSPTPFKEGRNFAEFNRAGSGLVIARANFEKQAMELVTASFPNLGAVAEQATGYPSAVCPTADIVCTWTPPTGPEPRHLLETAEHLREQKTRLEQGPDAEALQPQIQKMEAQIRDYEAKAKTAAADYRPQRLVLYDLAAHKGVAELPINEKNSKLDDWECQWTADGRYLYYYDVRDSKQSFSRVWDRIAGKAIAEVDDAVAVGPGPTPTTMFLARLRWTMDQPAKGFLLHDAATGKSWALGEGTDLIHASGRAVVYSRKDAAGVDVPYVAEVEMARPDAAGARPAPAPDARELLKSIPVLTNDDARIESLLVTVEFFPGRSKVTVAWRRDGRSSLFVTDPAGLPVAVIAEGRILLFDSFSQRIVSLPDRCRPTLGITNDLVGGRTGYTLLLGFERGEDAKPKINVDIPSFFRGFEDALTATSNGRTAILSAASNEIQISARLAPGSLFPCEAFKIEEPGQIDPLFRLQMKTNVPLDDSHFVLSDVLREAVKRLPVEVIDPAAEASAKPVETAMQNCVAIAAARTMMDDPLARAEAEKQLGRKVDWDAAKEFDRKLRDALKEAGTVATEARDPAPPTPTADPRAKEVDALIAQFTALEFAVRQAAVDKLIAMGPAVAPQVAKARDATDDAEVKMRCEMVLRGIVLAQPGGKERLEAEALIAKLSDPDAAVREEAVRALVLAGAPVLPVVRRALAETADPGVKACCERVIRGIGEGPSPRGQFVPFPAAGDGAVLREHVFGDFEDGTCEGWGGWCGARLVVVEDARAHGKRWMRMDLADKYWPGMGVHFGPNTRDWSRYRAIRASAFNPHDYPVRLCVTATDTRGDSRYVTRYSDDYGIPLQPGANDIEVPVGALKAGSPGCRGLDVRNLVYFTLFVSAGPGQPRTLYVDNVRLVPPDGDAPAVVTLADFDGRGAAKWTAAGAGALGVAKRPDGADGSALRVSCPDGPAQAGVEFDGFDGNWLSHDVLAMDVLRPKGQPGPARLSIAITGADDRSVRLATGLAEGLNRLRLPLDFACHVATGGVTRLVVLAEGMPRDAVLFVDNVRLERSPGLLYGGCWEPAASGPLTVDFTDLHGRLGLADQYGFIARVPLAQGGIRAVHGIEPQWPAPAAVVTRYVLPPTALDGMKLGAPIEVWGRLRMAGQWYWTRKEITPAPGEPATLKFDDAGAFGCETPGAAP